MAVVLRYELGITLRSWVRQYLDLSPALVAALARATPRIGFQLPAAVARAHEFLLVLLHARRQAPSHHARRCAGRVVPDLTHSLGLPLLGPGCGNEGAFLHAIDAAPHDLGAWAAYADWLEESDSAEKLPRAAAVRGWLGAARVRQHRGRTVVFKNAGGFYQCLPLGRKFPAGCLTS